MPNYYDYILAAIPATFVVPTILLTATGIPLTQIIPVSGIAAAALVAHGMFINTPTPTLPTPLAQEPETKEDTQLSQ